MNDKILKYIPSGKADAIKDCYHDDDGYWIILKEGYEASRTDSGCRTIHEDTIKELRYQIAGIQRCESEKISEEAVTKKESKKSKKMYFFGYISKDDFNLGTAKAFPIQYGSHQWVENDPKIKWIPRSICITETTELLDKHGWMKIYIPAWFFRKNYIEMDRILDIRWGDNGVDPAVYI